MSSHCTAALSLFLLLEPGAPPPDSQSPQYADAVAAVERGVVEINTNPEQGIAVLRAALAALYDHAPALAHDHATLELRTLAELSLARALLSVGDIEAATTAVDAALEGLAGASLPVAQLGPSLGALVEDREQALAARGQAQLRVVCTVPCEVYVDERSVDRQAAIELPVGEHRVWIASAEREPLRTRLTLEDRDAVLTLAYPEPSFVPPPVAGVAAPPTLARGHGMFGGSDHPRDRVAPRWVEVTTVALGVAALAAGATLWAIDSRCPRGANPNDLDACPQLFDTRTPGIAVLAAGAAATLTGGVMLGIDETRIGDRRGTELALVWTTQF